MKTAKEWFYYFNYPINKYADAIHIEQLKQIQLDAWKTGMSDAAVLVSNELTEQGDQYGSFLEVSPDAAHLKEAILTARDDKKSL